MNRAIPEFVGIPATDVTCWTAAHADLHWANLIASPLRYFDWEAWGQAPQGVDCATLYAYTLLQPDVAAGARRTRPPARTRTRTRIRPLRPVGRRRGSGVGHRAAVPHGVLRGA
jgi:hypothetical protein